MKCIAFILVFIFLVLFIQPVNCQQNSFDKYGGWTGVKGDATGCFHTQKIGNRWWIITPSGNAFFAIIMSSVRISGIPEAGSKRRPYKEACFNKYHNEATWAEICIKRLREWGFNTIGNWSSKSVFSSSRLPYLMDIGFKRDAPNVIPKGKYGYFPDIFDPRFEASFRANMEEKLKWHPQLIDDPWLIGYFLSDEPAWYGGKQRRGALVDDFIALPKNSYGKKAWVDFVKNKYSKINDLDLAWGIKFKSFDELFERNKINDDNETMTKDKLDFLRFIAEEFSKKMVNILREYDKRHMILGSRPTRNYPEVIEGIGKYTDIYAVSYHHLNEGYRISSDFENSVEEIYDITQKPILLGVIISASDSGFAHAKVRTQRDRGISYWRYLKKLASNPRIVGISWFQYFDPPLKSYDKQVSNWGLVNEQDEPYEKALKLISQANDMVYSYALGLSNYTPEFDTISNAEKATSAGIPVESGKIGINLVHNPSFEQGEEGWKLQAWKGKAKALLDTSTRHTGQRSLKIEGGPDEGWASVGVGVQNKPNFSLNPGHRYKISAWIKTKNVYDAAFLRIKVQYKSGDTEYFVTENIYGTNEWKYIEKDISARGENTVQYLAAQLKGKGVAWFDDISLEEIKE